MINYCDGEDDNDDGENGDDDDDDDDDDNDDDCDNGDDDGDDNDDKGFFHKYDVPVCSPRSSVGVVGSASAVVVRPLLLRFQNLHCRPGRPTSRPGKPNREAEAD